MTPSRAIVIGATGAVGSALVQELLASPHFEMVRIVTRREVPELANSKYKAKLEQVRIDMDHIERDVLAVAKGCDVAFCTMGIGQPSKTTKEEFWKVDVGYASAFARACKAAKVKHISLLSAAGADAKASTYYMHVKGSVEAAYRALSFERTTTFRPSLLVTKGIRYGLQDRFFQTVTPLVSWMLPSKFHEIKVEDLARAMRINAEREATETFEILHYRDFERLLE